MKRIRLPFAALSVMFAWASAPAESVPSPGRVLPTVADARFPLDTEPRAFDEKGYHVQGAAASDRSLYLSQMEWLYQFDWSGRLVKKAKVLRHTGDLCWHNGLLYTIAMGYDAGPLKGVSVIRVYDEDLDLVRSVEIGRVGADGIAVLDDVVYVGLETYPSRIAMYALDTFRKLGERTVDYGYQVAHGVQNLVTDGRFLYGAFYSDGDNLVKFDRDLNVVGSGRFPLSHVGQGLDVHPSRSKPGKPVFLHVRSRNVDDIPHGKSSHATVSAVEFTVEDRDTRPWIINWWQGMDVEESGLARQFDAFRKAGFGGVRVVPVYGLKAGGPNEVKYLSAEGNRRLAVAQRLARERGLGFEAAGGPGFTFGDASIRPVGGFRRPLKCVSRADAGWMINPFDTGSMRDFLALWEALPFKPAGMFHDSYDYRGAEADGDCGDRLSATFGEWTAWCRRLGVRSRYQAHGSPGDWLDLYALADIPETEMLGTPNDRKIILAKFASSAAHAGGKRIVSGETGTWRGEHFTVSLANLKQCADAMFVAGVNEIVFHGCCYSPEGETWPGRCFYAASEINPRNPIWRHIDALNGYVTRVQRLLRQCEPDNDVTVAWPVGDRLRSFASAERARMTMNNADEWCFSQPFGQEALRLWREGYSFDFTSSGSAAPAAAPRREPFGAARGLWYVRLKRSDETVYFVVNASSRPVRGEFLPTAVAEGRRSVEMYDPWTGRSAYRAATQKGVQMALDPQASVFLICRSTAPVRVPKPREVTVIDLGRVNGSARVSANGLCIGTVIQPPYEIEVPDGLSCRSAEDLSVEVVTVAANRIRALDNDDPGWKDRYDGHPVLSPSYTLFSAKDWPLRPDAVCEGPIVLRKEVR